MQLADLTPPDTQAARAAREVAGEYLSAALLNHSLRSWCWAVGFALLEGRGDIDDDLLYVSAVLHDVGLAEEFDNHTLSYEHAGGHVARAVTAGAGWERARRDRALEVIVRHNWPSVDPALDVEGYLLETATALDISGGRPTDLPAGFRAEVLERYPRLHLAAEFTACVADQAIRKPSTAAARLVAGGLAQKLATHPLE